jgi:restriction system protein
MEIGPILEPHGGYRNLEAYKLTVIIYDGTVAFCNRCIDPRSRTTDQMIQAARSGKQNIVEGSMVAATSRKSELLLIGVARGSLEELLNDYEDYLRQNRLEKWHKDHPKARYIRNLARKDNKAYDTYQQYIEQKSVETAANTMLCLIYQACFLLDRIKMALETRFISEGGVTEKMHSARMAAKHNNKSSA